MTTGADETPSTRHHQRTHTELPGHGLEFAGMFAQFGSQVVLVDHHDRFMPGEDRDVAEAVHSLLIEQGVEITVGGAVTSVRDGDGVIRVGMTLPDHDSGTELETDAVLLATGRRSTTAELGLDAAGIQTDDRGSSWSTSRPPNCATASGPTHPSSTEALNEVLAGLRPLE